MQSLFQRNSGPLLRALFFVLLSVVFMVTDQRFQQLDQVRVWLAGAVAPLRYAVDMPTRWVGWGTERMRSRANLIDQVETLRRRNLRLRARQLRFETLQSQNKHLRQLLDASEKRDDRVKIAQLLSVDLDPYSQQVVVNRGRDENVYRGQPLIDAYGVMGQIVQTGPMTSTALLISDANHALPVQITRTGLRSVAEGTGGSDHLELRYILNKADIEVGDAVVTSGLGGRFPPNYPVATVSKVERRPGRSFAKVTAKPKAHLDRSRNVLLVWPDTERGDSPRGEPSAPPKVDNRDNDNSGDTS